MICCHICNSNTSVLGAKKGSYFQREFEFRKCESCGFVFVSNPIIDYKGLYDEDYYMGNGADRTVDYVYELYNPSITIRRFEWYGIVKMLNALLGGGLNSKKWLDIGCGNGGLVRYARSQGIDCVRVEDGWIADKARNEFSIPIISLDCISDKYDIITAKVLKTLNIRNFYVNDSLLSFFRPLIKFCANLVDMLYQISDMPFGRCE